MYGLKNPALIVVMVVVVTLSMTTQTLAGGLRLYEITATEIALAGAGWAARAEDPNTLFTNPAGLTRLDGSQFQLHLHGLYGDVALTPNDDTTIDGSDGGNAIGFLPGGSAYYSHKASDRLAWGVGLVSNFGLALAYDDDWAGRYFTQEATLVGVSIVPSVGYRVSDTVSLGIAIEAMYAVFKDTSAIRNLGPQVGDGSLEVDDSTWGYGIRLGVLFEPLSSTRFGLTYNTETSLDFSTKPEFDNLGPLMEAALQAAGLLDAGLNVSMAAPQGVMASFYHEASDTWAIVGNLGWEDWSEFGRPEIEVATEDPISLIGDLNYKDSYHAALGARHRLEAPWILSFGLAYDSSIVDDKDRTVDLPMGANWRFGFGGTHRMGSGLELTLAYELAWGGTLSLDQQSPLAGRLSGEYKSTALHFFGATLHWGAGGES